MADSPVARAYDLVASEYDAQLAQNPVAAEMRRRLHAHFDRVFRTGDAVLDFTAGTGVDALYLATTRGISVTALDVSPGMIAELRRRVAGHTGAIVSSVLPAEHMSELDGHFDGAVSTFAGLNTIEDMPRLARDLGGCIKPGGHIVLHGLNGFCFWQWSANLLRRRKRDRFLRVGAVSVPHRLYDPFVLWRGAFAPYFELRQVYALSVIAAPTVIQRMPRCAPLLFRLDQAAGRLFPAAGDFFVMDLVRTNERGHFSA